MVPRDRPSPQLTEAPAAAVRAILTAGVVYPERLPRRRLRLVGEPRPALVLTHAAVTDRQIVQMNLLRGTRVPARYNSYGGINNGGKTAHRLPLIPSTQQRRGLGTPRSPPSLRPSALTHSTLTLKLYRLTYYELG